MYRIPAHYSTLTILTKNTDSTKETFHAGKKNYKIYFYKEYEFISLDKICAEIINIGME